MNVRRALVVGMVAVGFLLQAVAFFWFAAPLGTPTGVEFSEPRLAFAPGIFILGVVLVFSSALVYELRRDPGGGTR